MYAIRSYYESVYEATKGMDYEIIYVDNASTDGSVDMVKKGFPEVKIIENRITSYNVCYTKLLRELPAARSRRT